MSGRAYKRSERSSEFTFEELQPVQQDIGRKQGVAELGGSYADTSGLRRVRRLT
jgi:hypothetical protein